jgi:hypothetical protein
MELKSQCDFKSQNYFPEDLSGGDFFVKVKDFEEEAEKEDS